MTPFALPRREQKLLRRLQVVCSETVKRTSALTPGARSLEYAAAERLVRDGLAEWDDSQPCDYEYRRLRLAEENRAQ